MEQAPTDNPNPGNEFIQSDYHVVPNALTATECDRVQAMMVAAVLRPGRTGPNGSLDPAIRSSEITFLKQTAETDWLYQRVIDLVLAVNATHFRFELEREPEALQLSAYPAGAEGHYRWHVDRGPANAVVKRRKLSLSIQLSEPDAYQGGDLSLNTTGMPFLAPRERGTAILFPAFVVHRVMPVFRGERHSLVGWFPGPPFR